MFKIKCPKRLFFKINSGKVIFKRNLRRMNFSGTRPSEKRPRVDRLGEFHLASRSAGGRLRHVQQVLRRISGGQVRKKIELGVNFVFFFGIDELYSCLKRSTLFFRYYGGNEYIDQMELLCQKRALQVKNRKKSFKNSKFVFFFKNIGSL